MVARDPLVVLARLRHLESDQARRVLAERLARGATAVARAGAAAAAIGHEAMAGRSEAFGAWLPRGLAERERAAHIAAIADRESEAARAALAEALAAERVVQRLIEERRRTIVRAVARADQAALDDRCAARTIPPRA